MVVMAVSFVDALKASAPLPVRRMSRRLKQWLKDRGNRHISLKDVFSEIYEKRLWGGHSDHQFYSGPGSDDQATAPYCGFVRQFIAENGIRRVVDLGCGDFRVGRQIAPVCAQYTGVDIVDPLIAENRRRFGSEHIAFKCLDMTRDELPAGELCLIREVLQHLSNAQIVDILGHVQKYPYVLITDAQPANISGFRVNGDKVHGASSRFVHGSCLQFDKPPFNVAAIEQVFETDVSLGADDVPYGPSFRLRTFLVRNR